MKDGENNDSEVMKIFSKKKTKVVPKIYKDDAEKNEGSA